MSEKKYDIAIVGGGMVGCTLAILLARANPSWSIVLLESQPFKRVASKFYQPSFDARSTALARGTVEVFEQLGLWPKLSRHASAIERVHISDRGHLGGALISAEDYDLDAVGAVVENARLGAVLIEQLAEFDNIAVMAPAQVERLVPKQGGYRLRLEDAELEASLCVICDGVESPLRQQLGIDVEITDYHQWALIANVQTAEPHNHVAYERFTDTGPMALLPLGRGAGANTMALVWTLPEREGAAVLALDECAFLKKLQRRFGHRLGEFNAVSERSGYPLKRVLAREQVRSNLVLMGNAAHFLHPVAGQGFNLALRDCVSLAETLVKANAPLGDLATLQNYLHKQMFDQQVTVQFSHGITQLFSSSALPQMALRALGFVGLEFCQPAKSLLAKQTMGLAASGGAALE